MRLSTACALSRSYADAVQAGSTSSWAIHLGAAIWDTKLTEAAGAAGVGSDSLACNSSKACLAGLLLSRAAEGCATSAQHLKCSVRACHHAMPCCGSAVCKMQL